MRTKDNKEIHKKFEAFTRDDLDKLHIFWCFPFYCTFWLRGMLVVIICAFSAFVAELLVWENIEVRRMYATERGKNIRHAIVSFLCRLATGSCFFMAGYTRYSTTKATHIDYKEFLGPDWKQEFEGASVIFANHTTWFDPAFMYFYYAPCMTAREGFRSTPFVGTMLNAVGCIFIKRTGGEDAKDSKKHALEAIGKHQLSVEKGETKTPMMIFPEGAGTRQNHMI